MNKQGTFLDKVKPAIGTDNGLQFDLDGNEHYFESVPTEHVKEAARNLKQHRIYKQVIEDWRIKTK